MKKSLFGRKLASSAEDASALLVDDMSLGVKVTQKKAQHASATATPTAAISSSSTTAVESSTAETGKPTSASGFVTKAEMLRRKKDVTGAPPAEGNQPETPLPSDAATGSVVPATSSSSTAEGSSPLPLLTNNVEVGKGQPEKKKSLFGKKGVQLDADARRSKKQQKREKTANDVEVLKAFMSGLQSSKVAPS